MISLGLTRNAFPAINPGTAQALAVGSASTATAAAIGTILVRLVSTVDCYVAFGSTPTATTSSMFLPAKIPEYFVCATTDKIAVLEATGAGSLYRCGAIIQRFARVGVSARFRIGLRLLRCLAIRTSGITYFVGVVPEALLKEKRMFKRLIGLLKRDDPVSLNLTITRESSPKPQPWRPEQGGWYRSDVDDGRVRFAMSHDSPRVTRKVVGSDYPVTPDGSWARLYPAGAEQNQRRANPVRGRR